MSDRPERRLVRRSDPAGPRPPFRVVASTIGLPLVAFVIFIVYQWAAHVPPAADERQPVTSTTSPAAVVTPGETPAAAPSLVPQPSRGTIALILDDVGYDPAAAEEAASLGTTLTFAVIPGTPHAGRSADLLASLGFEVLCHLPMEPIGYPAVSPGEGAILRSMSNDEIRVRTRALFRSVPHARGINNHMGSAATADVRVMENVLAAVREEGVFFIDSRTTGRSISGDVARRLGVRTASRDVFLDDDPSEAAIRRQVRELAASAEDGVAIGIGHLYPSTLRVLRDELPRLQREGFRFISASEAVR